MWPSMIVLPAPVTPSSPATMREGVALSIWPPNVMRAACDSCGVGSGGFSIDLAGFGSFFFPFLLEVVLFLPMFFFTNSALLEGGVGRFGMMVALRVLFFCMAAAFLCG